MRKVGGRIGWVLVSALITYVLMSAALGAIAGA
jgi:hypothetical protein